MKPMGDRSLKNLELVHPDMVKLVKLAHIVYPLYVIEGKRSKERQAELLKSGASKTMNSLHCVDPLSLAVDIAPLDFDWKKAEHPNELRKCYYLAGVIKAIAHFNNIGVRFGGDWDGDNDFSDQTFNDLLHFELKGIH